MCRPAFTSVSATFKHGRLRKKKEFVACYDYGKRFHSKHFLFFVLPIKQDGRIRTGLTVSRKVGCAVVRNRIKRLLREFFRLSAGELPGDCDIVAVAKKTDFAKFTLKELTSELLPLFAKSSFFLQDNMGFVQKTH